MVQLPPRCSVRRHAATGFPPHGRIHRDQGHNPSPQGPAGPPSSTAWKPG
ncbi:hypothetical protein ACFFX0_21865 [Citricoccus parietis]|uniref:Uncharacterized protein n=1 Tax=Citricoccus parietis TaxID=592307 RepID=A0ABV5G469_9MICC